MDKTKLTPEEQRKLEIDETTDMITAEDMVEQAVYAANAPDCCADEQAENMLGMLGANIVEPEIYHDESECPNRTELEAIDYKKAVEESVEQEFAEFRHGTVIAKTPEEIFDSSRRIFVMSEMHNAICDSFGFDDEVYEALYQDRGHILLNLHDAFEGRIEPSLGTPGDATELIENYCREEHADIMNGVRENSLTMGGM